MCYICKWLCARRFFAALLTLGFSIVHIFFISTLYFPLISKCRHKIIYNDTRTDGRFKRYNCHNKVLVDNALIALYTYKGNDFNLVLVIWLCLNICWAICGILLLVSVFMRHIYVLVLTMFPWIVVTLGVMITDIAFLGTIIKRYKKLSNKYAIEYFPGLLGLHTSNRMNRIFRNATTRRMAKDITDEKLVNIFVRNIIHIFNLCSFIHITVQFVRLFTYIDEDDDEFED